MVYERNCGAIVMLSAISENGEVYRKGRWGREEGRIREEKRRESSSVSLVLEGDTSTV